MSSLFSRLPISDLRQITPAAVGKDASAAAAVTVLGVPQNIAYAMIAGLPPAMGLYAAIVPTIIAVATVARAWNRRAM